MIFRPDIKPPMWGPPDAVRYAVRVNAERLGVDPASIVFLAPAWENAGPVLLPVIGPRITIEGNPEWDNLGVRFNGTTDYAYNHDIAGMVSRFGGTMLLSCRQHASADTKYLMSMRGGTNDRYYLRKNGLEFQIGWGFKFDYTTGLYFVEGQPSCLALTWGPTGCRAYKDGYLGRTIATAQSNSPATFAISTLSSDFINSTFIANQSVDLALVLSKEISDATAQEITATPYALLMPVSRPVYFDLGAGGGTYTETLDTLITSISSVADRQAYRDTVDTLITSGATVDAVTGMVEALLSLGVSASTVGDVQGYADGVSDTIVSAGDAADAQDYVDGPATTGVSTSDETDTQSYVDNLGDTLVSASNVTDTTGTPPITESLLTTAASASNVSAAQAYVDTVTTLAHSSSSLAEVLGLVEQIGTVGESVSSLSDRQLYYDNVAIVALSSSSLAEVGAYIEQVAAAAVSASSLIDVLVGSFVGRYVFADYCRARSFEDFASPRIFIDYCRPRGRRLQ